MAPTHSEYDRRLYCTIRVDTSSMFMEMDMHMHMHTAQSIPHTAHSTHQSDAGTVTSTSRM